MSKIVRVTKAQLEHVRKLADDKKVGRDLFQQWGIDEGIIAAALDAMKTREKSNAVPGIIAPPGGRIHAIRVSVVLDQPWREAVVAAGPDTPGNYDVWKVGDLYPLNGTGTKECEIILVNFGRINFDDAIAWALKNELTRTDPRRVFAISKENPGLHHELKMSPMYVGATEECSFGGARCVCGVWWDGSERGARLLWTECVGGPFGWLAFSRE